MTDIRRYSPSTRSLSPFEFTGREAEVAMLRSKLIDEKVRLVLVAGDYRIGKTSLAMYFADRYKDTFAAKTECFIYIPESLITPLRNSKHLIP